jgi:hypothetical protein
MATFYDIYQNYLKNPYGGINALPQVNPSSGIINTNTISPIGGDSMGVSPVASINTNPNVTNTAPGTGIMGTNISYSDAGKALSFLMNPPMFIANLAATQVFGKSPMDMAMEAMGIGGFGGPQAGDLSYTDYSDADIGPMGPQAGDNTGNTNTNTGNTGFGDDNDGYGNDGDSSGVDSAGDGGDGYATGGRVGYAEGSPLSQIYTTGNLAEQIMSTKNSSTATPSLIEDFYKSSFYNPKSIGTSALVPVTLPTGEKFTFSGGAPAGQFQEYLKYLNRNVAPVVPMTTPLDPEFVQPYNTVQTYQRMEPDLGIAGFRKAFQAERPLESAFERFTEAAGPLTENINTAIGSLNPFQKQQYMNYAVQNPEQAIEAAQRNKDFLEATRKNITPTVSSPFLDRENNLTDLGLFPGGGGGQTTPLIDEGPKTPIGLFPGGGGGQTTPLTATSSLIEDFYKSSFSQKPTMGTQALVPITLPTGETYTLRSGGEASNFRDFLGSLNMAPETVDNIFEKRPETSPQLNIPLIDKGEIKPLMADGGRVFYLQGGLASLLG